MVGLGETVPFPLFFLAHIWRCSPYWILFVDPFIDGRQIGKHSAEALSQLPIVHDPGLEKLMPIGRFYLGYE
jgi:hypothetical protein